MGNHTSKAENNVESRSAYAFDMKIEVLVIPTTDVDRAKRFYTRLGWQLDLDFAADDGYRVIQFTPPGSACSIIFGSNVTDATPGSARDHCLVVSDILAAHRELVSRGIDVGPPFHDAGGIFHRADRKTQVRGPHPQRASYASYACFSDPDGNRWFLQEVTARLSNVVEAGDTRFTTEIVSAIRSRAEV
ncbi:glyoxalase [Caballeronia novacaledonica]|uniref:Glyoxalase n=1 Tax=Caballeronia novacaledonica TaxID=1544861 RepID=A0AA37IHZ2_9BURK|nr:VOC family protein [Caballeronia novacaledonica]GJH13245.1 glyoxalase [Caballeronia novacaledonica]GJH28998.1 glyoxalase [Caballeronia novacaledonica]